ncbi:S-layer homology domain-containing protein [Tepidimicrobium xylanilyticum]|uniref:S-layer homology domain-containing protein n=1 Tax=Tepidimicrobium xylanilyticum TaxID=1123352 RepID=UPI00264EC3D5|nr:S-layer homology domain-containing protein [Tepidimicrobium xylanilyticum]GMG95306.1 hypothetical protein EN5CB1_01320 [Tepidimicrobium xylanilyticum]
MKRKLSLLLAVVMILSSFSFVFADEEVNVPAFLEKNGILKGDKSGNLMLDKALERRDAVVLLSRLLKAEEEAKNYEPAEDEIYPDNNDPYYAGFLGWATANGYFEGYPNGNFKPRESILVQEFALVLLRALEYGDTEWKSVMDKAKELGILEGVKEADANAAIVREDVATMIFNALGVKMKKEGKTLAEFLGITMPEPAKLTAEVKDTENLKEVVVKLSNAKLANKDKLENTANYRIKGNTIERVEVKDNDVLVQVKDTFRSGKQYELEIKGVDKAIDGKYKFVAKDNTIPSVEKVEVLGEYGIKVVASEPIEDVRGRNFLVDGKYIVMDVETYGRNLVLTPYSGSFPSNAKTLTIEGLKDFAGYKSAKEDFEIEIVKDNEAPKVVDAILKGNKVEVVFDKDIYNDSIEAYEGRSSVGNISYESGRHTIYAKDAKKIDTNKVVYEFKDNEAPSRRDDVTIVDVTNHSKVKMEKTTIALREVLDDIEPEIVEKKLVAKDVDKGTATIELHFDKEVSGSFLTDKDDEYRFEPKDHFTLYEDEVSRRNESKDGKVASAEYRYDKRNDKYEKDVIVVKLEGLKEWKKGTPTDFEYILEIEDFRDISSSRNKMYRDYYEFEFKRGTDFVVEDVKVTLKGSRDTEIEIKFSKKLDLEKAEDGTNYIFYKNDGSKRVSKKDIKDLDGKARLQSNGRVVELDIPKGWDDIEYDYDGLKILESIKDTSGNRLDRVYYYDFASGKLLEEGQTVDQTLDEAVEAVKDALAKFKADNTTDETAVLTAVKKVVTNNEIDVAIKGFNKVNAETGKSGAITGKVELALEENGTTIIKTVDINITIPALDQTLDQAKTEVEKVVGTTGSFKADNDTTEADVLEAVKKVVTNKNIEVGIFGFKVTKATTTTPGKVEGSVSLKLDGEEEIVTIDRAIGILPLPTYKVTIEGDAAITTDYTLSETDLENINEGTTLTITAVSKIVVNGNKVLEPNETTDITINDNTTITINKAQ